MMLSRILTPLSAALYVVVSLAPVGYCGPTTSRDIFMRTPAAGIDIQSFAPQLSPASKVYIPGSDEFTTYTVRWSNLEPPTPNVVIAPGTEQDVAKILGASKCFQCGGRVVDIVPRLNSPRNITFPSSHTMVTMVL